MIKLLSRIVVGATALFLLLQLVPYGRNHNNPPVIQEPQWGSTQAQQIARQACYDCHSNETAWPWYTNIAPMSWLIQRDVEEGRIHLNFSEWGMGDHEDHDLGEAIREGEMPPRQYTLIHPEARLDAARREILLDGLPADIGSNQGESGTIDHHKPRQQMIESAAPFDWRAMNMVLGLV